MKRKKLTEVRPLLNFKGLEGAVNASSFLVTNNNKTALRSASIAFHLLGMKKLHSNAFHKLTEPRKDDRKLQAMYKDVFFTKGKAGSHKRLYVYEDALPWYLFSMLSGSLTRDLILSQIWTEAKRMNVATPKTQELLEGLNASKLSYAQIELSIANTDIPVPVVTHKQVTNFLQLMPQALSANYVDGKTIMIPMTTAEYDNAIYKDSASRITQNREQKLILNEGGVLTVFGFIHLIMNLIADYHIQALPKVKTRPYTLRSKSPAPVAEVVEAVQPKTNRNDVLALLMRTQTLLETGLTGSIDPEQAEAVLLDTYSLRIKMLKS